MWLSTNDYQIIDECQQVMLKLFMIHNCLNDLFQLDFTGLTVKIIKFDTIYILRQHLNKVYVRENSSISETFAVN